MLAGRTELRLLGLLAAQSLLQLFEEAGGLTAVILRDEGARRRGIGLFVVVLFRHALEERDAANVSDL